MRLSAKSNIIRADGDIMLDGQPVRCRLDARIDPKIRASILETDAARMRSVEGERTMGNAATTYTAHADESGVRHIGSRVEPGQIDFGLVASQDVLRKRQAVLLRRAGPTFGTRPRNLPDR